ncbi:MAG: hypothetical protein K6L76_05495 [Agarilytica sp.]
MYRLIHQNKILGASLLESGDPSIGSASGKLVEAGACEDMVKWMQAEGGVAEDGVHLLEIDKNFLVMIGPDNALPFEVGAIICVPEEDEMFLEINGIPAPEYAHFFPKHMEAFQEENK